MPIRFLGSCSRIAFPVCALAAAPLLLFLPFLYLPAAAFFGNSDALFYADLLKLTAAHMAAGEMYPRWLAEANGGFGSPVFYYYAPLAYQLSALLTAPLAWFGAGTGARFLVGIYLSQAACGITAWRWLTGHFSPRVALCGALLYVLLPYKFIDIFLHANLALLWALAWLPLWLTGCERLAEGRRGGIALFATGAALVCLTHQLTLLAAGPVMVAYVLWRGRAAWRRTLLRIVAGGALGAAASSIYWLPMLSALPWLDAQAWLAGKFDAADNLNHVDTLLALYVPVAAVAVYMLARRTPGGTRDTPFWLTAIFILTALTFSPSAPLWRLPPLAYLQFPAARFQAALLPGVTYALCIMLERAWKPALAFAAVALCALPILWRVAGIYNAPAAAALTNHYVEEMRRADMLPVSGHPTHWSALDAPATFARAQTPQPQASLAEGRGTARVETWASQHIVVATNIAGPRAVLQVRQFYIPLWRAQDEAGRAIPVQPAAPDGLLSLPLDSRAHRITLTLAAAPGERASLALSLLAWAVIIVLLFPSLFHRPAA